MRDLAAGVPAFASSDPTESIGFAPAPGAQRRFSAGELRRLAARKGVDTAIEPVCFERRLSELTSEQDWELCEKNYAGIASRGYRPGPLSPVVEASVESFLDWYVGALGAGQRRVAS